jgi:hypothetical protein
MQVARLVVCGGTSAGEINHPIYYGTQLVRFHGVPPWIVAKGLRSQYRDRTFQDSIALWASKVISSLS